MFTLNEVLQVTGGRLLSPDSNTKVTFSGVSTDSRTVKPDELFIAIKGDKFDGHNFLEGALRKGAAGAIISDNVQPSNPNQRPLIKAADTIQSLGDIARFHREKFDVPIVGITGSNGKTTTKDITAAILSQQYKTLKSEGTFNNHIGVPQTILKLTEDFDAAVLELGMNHMGEIAYLGSIVRPNVALITNIGPSHLEFLKDLDGVMSAKSEILQYLDEEDAVILNGDDEYLSAIKYTRARRITFGIKNKSCDFVAADIIHDEQIGFSLNGKTKIRTNLLGEQNVYNALAACAVASLFDITPAQLQDALANFKPPSMRTEQLNINGVRIINDSYNSNPLSMTYSLYILNRITTKGKKILIMGDMLELGKLSEQYHYNIGKQAAALPLDLFITVGRMCKHSKEGAKEAGMPAEKLHWFDSSKDAAEFVKPLVVEGDVLLVKGSRKMMMERVIECFTISIH